MSDFRFQAVESITAGLDAALQVTAFSQRPAAVVNTGHSHDRAERLAMFGAWETTIGGRRASRPVCYPEMMLPKRNVRFMANGDVQRIARDRWHPRR